jgi:hypothetical protein
LADQLHRAFPVGIGAGINFACTCEKGAILVLPDGAFREDLRRLEKFRHAAEHNAMAWYGHARNCGLNPESLYLVTGCVKTSSWGVASILNASEERSACLKFTAASVAEASASYSYLWETYSPVDVRNGPKPPSEVQNQCVFLRGFKISFNENIKTLWSRKISFEIVDESDENHHGTRGGRGVVNWFGRRPSQFGSAASSDTGTSTRNTRHDVNVAFQMVPEMSEVCISITFSDTSSGLMRHLDRFITHPVS